MSEHSDIELTEDEIADALTRAKSLKFSRMEREREYQRRLQKGNELIKTFTPGELINYCMQFYFDRFGKYFDIDKQNKKLVEKLSQYFTGSEEFNQGEYLLSKGLLIMGNVGTGKTELMKFFQKNKKRCYKIVSCNEVADDYLIYKGQLEDVYSSVIEKPLLDPGVFFQKCIGLCFDDLGTEENKNAFGNKKNVMGDVILAIYAKKDFGFHITTNLDEKELEDRYGTRVMSRLNEMFNFFVLDGTDRRK